MSTPRVAGPAGHGREPRLAEDRAAAIGVRRILAAGTLTGLAFLLVGVALMAATGVSPEGDTFPPFDPGRIPGDLLALRPEGYLWTGIAVFIATPVARVFAELATYTAHRERHMIRVAVAILAVVALSILASLLVEV